MNEPVSKLCYYLKQAYKNLISLRFLSKIWNEFQNSSDF